MVQQTAKRAWLAPVVMSVVFVLFRTPALLNAACINSDGAVTALQAMHIQHGEWAWLHWGRDYLTSIDSVVAAFFFALFSPTPKVIMGVTILGQLTSMWLAFAMLRRRFSGWVAAVGVTPILFTTLVLNIYLFFNIRQWCLAAAMAGFWLLDGASSSKRPQLRYALGMFVGVMSVFIDLFALQFMPGLGVFAVLSCFDGQATRAVWWGRLRVVAASAMLSGVLVRFLERTAHVTSMRTVWSLDLIPKNTALLRETCLPWLLGVKVFADQGHPFPDLWAGPAVLGVVQALAGVLVAAAFVTATVGFFIRRIPYEIRRLGALGVVVAASCFAGFSISAVASDMWAGRLLAPVVLTMPFVLAPGAYLLRGWRFAAVMSPYVAALLVAGWVGFGPFVDGLRPQVTDHCSGEREMQVAAALRQRGVKMAAGHYWLAYRLTFLFQENPVVAPIESEDRYPPYRTGFNDRVVAYLFHADQPWLTADQYEARFRASGQRVERQRVADFDILYVYR